MKWRTSLTFVYFFTGFLLMAALTMATLVLLRPLMGDQPAVSTRTIAMYAPLITGIGFGVRVVWLGMKQELSLGQAIKKGFTIGSSTSHD